MSEPDGSGVGTGHRGRGQNGQKEIKIARSSSSIQMPARHRWGVILAGGDGMRLQSLTRLACGDDRPKQFCPLLGGKTLLTNTRQRISRTIDRDRQLFVLTKKHEQFYEEELEYIAAAQKVVQPHNRGTLPAILWSLLRIFREDEQALVAFFPSDHYFANEDAFISTIERTFDFIDEDRRSVILLGAGAERPETEYGWIEPEGIAKAELGRDFVPVRRFWEKPSLSIARELLAQGCLWNTFVMIGSAGAFLEMIRQSAPIIFETFKAALLESTLESEEQKMQFVYDSFDACDFSREVLALKTERLLVANCGDVGWSDLGEPRRLIAALSEKTAENPRATEAGCSRCGLTREQIQELIGHQEPGAPCVDKEAALAST